MFIIEEPPGTVAYKLHEWAAMLPKFNVGGPPIILDDVFDEIKILLAGGPLPITEHPGGVLILTVQGFVLNEAGKIDHTTGILDIECLPHKQGTEIRLRPYFDNIGGIVERIEGQLMQLFFKASPLPTPKESAQAEVCGGEEVTGGKYGTCRDLSFDDVKTIVVRCKAFQKRGGKVPEFYRHENITSNEPRSYELETLKGWLKDPRFSNT